MGEWYKASYVRCSDTARLTAVVAKLLEIEGYVAIGPNDGELDDHERREMQYGDDEGAVNCCGLAFWQGKSDWTTITTRPADFLCHSVRGMTTPRLAYIAYGVLREAVHISVEDGAALFILECNPARLAMNWYGQHLSDVDVVDQMFRINLQYRAADGLSTAKPSELHEQKERHLDNTREKIRLIEELRPLNAISGTPGELVEWLHKKLTGEPDINAIGMLDYEYLKAVKHPPDVYGESVYFRKNRFNM